MALLSSLPFRIAVGGLAASFVILIAIVAIWIARSPQSDPIDQLDLEIARSGWIQRANREELSGADRARLAHLLERRNVLVLEKVDSFLAIPLGEQLP